MTIAIIIASLIGACVLFVALANQRNHRRREQRTHVERYAFPVALRLKMREAYPSLSDDQISAVFEGLRQWFLLLHAHPRTKFGMPSKAVDSAWHAFILMTRQYQAFCEKAFGRYVHHEPNEPGTERDSNAALARTLATGAGGLAGGAMLGGAVGANLFAIDHEVGIDNGNVYDPMQLEELRRMEQEAKRGADGGGCSGGVSVSCGSDGDSGGDGGSGCGGGCGS
jgi:hypothetical protein